MSGVTSTWFAPPPPCVQHNIVPLERNTHVKERKKDRERQSGGKEGGRGGGKGGGRGHRYPVTTPPLGNVPPNPFEKLNYGESAK